MFPLGQNLLVEGIEKNENKKSHIDMKLGIYS